MHSFFRRHYFGGMRWQAQEPAFRSRQIEEDWLGANWLDRYWPSDTNRDGDTLLRPDDAIQLNMEVDNTSLALAIELSPGGKVLLFPGDAQVGNWLSWHAPNMQWPRSDDPDNPVTAADLLRRTVLYKVGHYAGRNATLRQKGLELMESSELTALIAIDEDVARTLKGTGSMLFPPLLDRLQEKTGGRLLRSDKALPKQELSEASPTRRIRPVKTRLSDDVSYFELKINRFY
jgi:hypothetical protein